MRQNTHVAMSAQEYHDYISTSTGPWDDLLIRRFSEEYEPGNFRKTVVDVGTGTAVLPIRLAAMPLFERAYFIGTDLFADMVDTARTAIGAAGLADRIRMEEYDVHSMPFDDNSVDYIISRSTIHHWADPVQAFREIYRVLRSGGKAILHDPRRDPNPEFLEQFNAKRRAAGFEPNDLSEKYTADEVTAFLNAAGIGGHAQVRAPQEGPASMGYEVLIIKPANL